jgi:uncharacterized surface protein with fasciclin (FAS1) repeats
MLAAGLILLSGCGDPAAEATPAATAGTASAEQPTIAAALARLSEFAWLRRGLRDTGVLTTLSEPRGRYTLLAPRDTAFTRLGPEARAALFADTARPQLALTLRGMMIAEVLRADDLRTRISEGGGSVAMATLSGARVTFTLSGDELIVTSASGAAASMGTEDIGSGNGSIYVLDRWIGLGGGTE